MHDEDDVETAERREDAARIARRQRARDLREVMGTAAGRRFAWRVLNEAGLFQPSFVQGDAHLTAYNEGKRAAAMYLQRELQRVAAADYVRMVGEAMAQVELDAELLPEE